MSERSLSEICIFACTGCSHTHTSDYSIQYSRLTQTHRHDVVGLTCFVLLAPSLLVLRLRALGLLYWYFLHFTVTVLRTLILLLPPHATATRDRGLRLLSPLCCVLALISDSVERRTCPGYVTCAVTTSTYTTTLAPPLLIRSRACTVQARGLATTSFDFPRVQRARGSRCASQVPLPWSGGSDGDARATLVRCVVRR